MRVVSLRLDIALEYKNDPRAPPRLQYFWNKQFCKGHYTENVEPNKDFLKIVKYFSEELWDYSQSFNHQL